MLHSAEYYFPDIGRELVVPHLRTASPVVKLSFSLGGCVWSWSGHVHCEAAMLSPVPLPAHPAQVLQLAVTLVLLPLKFQITHHLVFLPQVKVLPTSQPIIMRY